MPRQNGNSRQERFTGSFLFEQEHRKQGEVEEKNTKLHINIVAVGILTAFISLMIWAVSR